MRFHFEREGLGVGFKFNYNAGGIKTLSLNFEVLIMFFNSKFGGRLFGIRVLPVNCETNISVENIGDRDQSDKNIGDLDWDWITDIFSLLETKRMRAFRNIGDLDWVSITDIFDPPSDNLRNIKAFDQIIKGLFVWLEAQRRLAPIKSTV